MSRYPHFVDNQLTDGGDVDSLTRRSLFTRKNITGTNFRGGVNPKATMRLEGLGQMETPMTSSGMDSATFRLAA
jgi:hypothetical protein